MLRNSDPDGREIVGLLCDLILRCLKLHPRERITPEQIVRHDFFRRWVPEKRRNEFPVFEQRQEKQSGDGSGG